MPGQPVLIPPILPTQEHIIKRKRPESATLLRMTTPTSRGGRLRDVVILELLTAFPILLEISRNLEFCFCFPRSRTECCYPLGSYPTQTFPFFISSFLAKIVGTFRGSGTVTTPVYGCACFLWSWLKPGLKSEDVLDVPHVLVVFAAE